MFVVSSAPPPPHPDRLRLANKAANAKSLAFDTTTPRLLVTPTFSIHEQGEDRRNVLVKYRTNVLVT
jgi:hypothetical protein